MADLRSLISQIPMEPGYVPAPPEPDLSVIQRLMGLPQTLRAVGQNLAVGAASLPVGIYQGFGNPAAGEAAMSQFQQEYGYTPTNPAAQRQLQGLGEFLQQLETEYKIPPIMAPIAATPALGIRGMVPQTERLARELVSEIQTTPPTGAVQLAPTPGLLEKSDIGFYSQLEAAVQPLQNKGTGQQYLAQIQKSAGVKPEEIQWTGLDEFLKNKQSVTKQEVQDYLAANRVDVKEVRLGENFAPGYQFSTYNEWEKAVNQAEAAGDVAEVSRLNEWAKLRYDTPNQTKFSQYTLPGGENYREILLTLPTSGSGGKRVRVYTQDGTSAVQVMSDADIQRMAESGRRRFEVLDEVSPQETFQSSHFDQPNILAHLRVNDRTVDGKKTLFVEEIQSDWHQAGRKKGYQVDKAVLDRQFDKLANEYQNVVQRRAETIGIPEFADEYNALQKEEVRLIAEMNRIHDQQSGVVPDAPFKTSWHELSLKRAIQEAAEKGYDQIAFTTGKTQAERYDLSKQVDSIVYAKENDGTYSVVAMKDGRELVKRDSVAESALPDLVGKEVAERMAASEGKAIPGGPERELSGENLRVGGEGMKGFYDNILPKSLDKLGKKFGAKVGKTDMDGVEVWQMDITPQMRESVTTKGQPLFAIPAIGAGLLGAEMMQEEQQY